MDHPAKRPLVLRIAGDRPDPASATLAAAGIEVVPVPDAAALVERARRDEPDLVLVEGAAGREAIGALRRDAAFARLPIVFLTDAPGAPFEVGASACLPAPLDLTALSALVGSYLRLREAERAAWGRVESLRVTRQRTDEFLATLGHELRNPLSAIRTGLSLLEHSGPDEARAAGIRARMARQTENLVRMVEDMLDVTRIAQGKLRLAAEALDLRTLIAAVVDVARPGFDAGVVSLVADLGDEAVVISGDATRLEQIVSNVLDNALKYTPAGGRVRVALAKVDADTVRLRIEDSGAGIDANQLGNLFAPFHQGDTRSSRRKGGLGIGLTVVQRLVEAHGGAVRITSGGPGRGSEVTIDLPVLPTSATLSVAASTHTSGVPASGVKVSRRVLLVDDNADAREMFLEVLTHEGHAVSTARDGEEALDLLLAQTFDVAVIDIGLPGIDGYGVARLAREWLGVRAPVLLALTGYAGPEDRDAARRAGFETHLPKPVNTAELAAAVASCRPNERDSMAPG